MVKRLRVMEKKLTNSGPFRESVDKHSIYTRPYDHPHDDRSVLCEPSSHMRHRAAEGPTGISDIYPAIRQRHQFECALSCGLPGGGLSGSHRPGAHATLSPGRATD